MRPRPNDIFNNPTDITVNLEEFGTSGVHARPVQLNRQQIVDARREKEASKALALLNRETELVGITKGQFSLLDLIYAALTITGPASLDISTWTANHQELASLAARKDVTAFRWLVDVSMSRRDPGIVAMIRERWGSAAVRVTHNHSKFVMLTNADWSLVCLTSMNLNMNPRMEHFVISHNPPLHTFLQDMLDAIWTRSDSRPERDMADLRREFRERH